MTVIENVHGAPLDNPVQYCGSSFGLDVRRHRLFESNVPLIAPECDHSWQTPRFKPATNRTNLRRTVEVGVWRIPLDVQQKAMGIDWLPLPKLSEAIPPAYTEHIGQQLMEHILAPAGRVFPPGSCGARVATAHPGISQECALPVLHDGEHSPLASPASSDGGES